MQTEKLNNRTELIDRQRQTARAFLGSTHKGGGEESTKGVLPRSQVENWVLQATMFSEAGKKGKIPQRTIRYQYDSEGENQYDSEGENHSTGAREEGGGGD